jgi:nicotinamidase/pyrazinamidase
MTNKSKAALIMIDLQNDFCRGGSLAVPDADTIISIANALQPHFQWIIATQDWHPHDHKSFASAHVSHVVGDIIQLNQISQVLWPDHCLQGSKGAAFHPLLNTKKINKVIQKGVDKEIDSYSAFFDNGYLRSTGLADYLHEHAINEIYMLGLATDYCVKYSCLDALKLHFNVFIIEDACRGININPGDVAEALNEMAEAGAHILHSKAILAK